MSKLRFNVPKLTTWTDATGVTHACFQWYSEVQGRTYWSTVCMDHDSLDGLGLIAMGPVTCVRCLAGATKP